MISRIKSKLRSINRNRKVICIATVSLSLYHGIVFNVFHNPVPIGFMGQYFFMGYHCQNRCEGHIAGYKWAEAKDRTDDDIWCPSKKTAKSESFREGCEAYLSEKFRGESDDYTGFHPFEAN